MKKLFTTILALVMALGLCSVSWAEERVVPVYPDGVNANSFPAVAVYVDDQGAEKNDKPALVAYVDQSGNIQYAADLNTAIVKGATVVYCKENATIMCSLTRGANRTAEMLHDVTIYANNANFQNTEISINNTSLSNQSQGKTKSFTLKVYDAKNIKIWGDHPAEGAVQNIYMENCHNVGETRTGNAGILVMVQGQTETNTGKLFVEINNCSVEKANTGIYVGGNGSLTVTGSKFEDCAAAIKVSFKGNGTQETVIKNCEFTACGCNQSDAGNNTWLADDSSAVKIKNSKSGTLTATIDNATITGTVGDKGDIQIESKTNPAGVTVRNTAAAVSVTKPGATDAGVTEVKNVAKNNTLTIAADGSAKVESTSSTGGYYYHPTTDTKTDTTKGSPKTFDAGIGIYALTAVLSVTGMAWTAKKRH